MSTQIRDEDPVGSVDFGLLGPYISWAGSEEKIGILIPDHNF